MTRRVLYPLSSFDTDTGHGWAFPYYRFERHAGLFPVAHFGDFNYVGLLWWRKNASGEIGSGGLFPVAYLGPEFKHVGPAWWTRGASGNVERGGLFPLAMFGSLNHVGPAWWRDEPGSWGLFPLLGFDLPFTSGVDHVRPTWLWDSGLPIATLGGIAPVPMAEYALMAILELAHRLPRIQRHRAERSWPSDAERLESLTPIPLHRSTLGIVGYGRIGREIARLGSALGMRVLGVRRGSAPCVQRHSSGPVQARLCGSGAVCGGWLLRNAR